MPASPATAATRSGVRSRPTPSASSTSAEPQEDDAARLPCLTTRTPAPATTIAAIVEMLTVWARSPPVPTMSTRRPGHLDPAGVRQHRVGQAAHLLDGLALGPQRDQEPGDLRRAGLAGHDLVHRPARASRGQVLPGEQRGEHGRATARRPPPGQWTRARHSARTSPAVRPSSATASASAIGSSGCGTASVGLRPGGQPAVLRTAGEHEHGRAVVDLVLELAAQPQPAGRRGLAVEDEQVERRRVSTASITAGAVAHSRQLPTSTSRAGRRPTATPDRVAGGARRRCRAGPRCGARHRRPWTTRGLRGWTMPPTRRGKRSCPRCYRCALRPHRQARRGVAGASAIRIGQ